MNIHVDDKARDFVKKKGKDSVYVYVKGCSS